MNPNSRLRNSSNEEVNLAVQVGEDAYFITDNAMGVADGVGGWRNRSGTSQFVRLCIVIYLTHRLQVYQRRLQRPPLLCSLVD